MPRTRVPRSFEPVGSESAGRALERIDSATRAPIFAVMALTSLVAAFALSGCGGGSSGQQRDDELVGRPPEASEDPFHFDTMPAEAVPAEPRGEIEESAPVAADEAPGGSAATARSEASDSSPERGSGEREQRSYQCFSCVRLCPIDDQGDAANCANAKEDTICGWGVDADAGRAGRLARAECNGALDMAREMPNWSRIEGECPPATCR